MEEWRPITGYEGLYEVSNLGRVRGVERLVWNKGGRAARYQRVKGTIKRPWLGGRYPLIRLCKDGVKFTVPVYRVVAEAFLGPPPDGCEVCHREGAIAGDAVSNLYWGTRKQNMQDSVRHGTTQKGERNWNAKLFEDDVVAMKNLRNTGITLTEIAKQFDVTTGTVSMAVRGITWSHVP